MMTKLKLLTQVATGSWEVNKLWAVPQAAADSNSQQITSLWEQNLWNKTSYTIKKSWKSTS